MKSRLFKAVLAGVLGVTAVVGGSSVSADGNDDPGPEPGHGACDPDFVKDRNGVRVVSPNGVDDTENITCAIDKAGEHWRNTVRLTEGTFHVDFMFNEDYDGLIKGAGRDRTTIEPLAGGLDCVAAFNELGFVFWMVFVGSDPTISDLSISIPDVACAEPWFEDVEKDPETGELSGFVAEDFNGMVLSATRGLDPAADCGATVRAGLTVKRVDVDAPQPDFMAPIFNPEGAFNAFIVTGTTPVGCDEPDRVSGDVVVTDSSATGVGSLIQANRVIGSNIRVVGNHTTGVDASVILLASEWTHAIVRSNVIEGATGVGIVVENCVFPLGEPLCSIGPLTALINRNDISVSEIGFAGIVAADGRFAPAMSHVNVQRNTITGGGNLAGVFAEGVERATIRRNTFAGASVFGVLAVGETKDSKVTDNDMTGLFAFEAGILLDEATVHNTVKRNSGATVVDLGTDNHVVESAPAVVASTRLATASTARVTSTASTATVERAASVYSYSRYAAMR